MIDKDAVREAVKKELSARMDNIDLAVADGYKTKQETQKRKKCSVCKKGFLGQDGATSCSDKCRQRKSRG